MKYTNEIERFVYDEYHNVSSDAYLEKIRFYENNEKYILELPTLMTMELRLSYYEALLEVGKYYNILKTIDDLIQQVIYENIIDVKGIDIFKELLLIKSQSLHYILDYHKSNHVLKELIKIDNSSHFVKKLYIKNNIDLLRYEGQKQRGLSILFFLLTGVVIAFEILAVRSFYQDKIFFIEMFRNVLFLLGIVTFVGQEIRIRAIARRRYQNIIKTK